MDPRRDAMDDEQFLMDMIASGSGGAAYVEEAGDGSNTNMYLNMSGHGIEQHEDDAADQETNVYILTTILCLNHICNEIHKTMTIYLYFFSPLNHQSSLNERSEAQPRNWKGDTL